MFKNYIDKHLQLLPQTIQMSACDRATTLIDDRSIPTGVVVLFVVWLAAFLEHE